MEPSTAAYGRVGSRLPIFCLVWPSVHRFVKSELRFLNNLDILVITDNTFSFPGITSLRIGQYAQQMVPIKEMTDVVRVVKERIGLRPRQWVRLKRGIYKDDLAQVDYVDMAQNQVHLKVMLI